MNVLVQHVIVINFYSKKMYSWVLSLFKYTVDKSFDHVHYLHCNIYLYNLSIQNFLPQLPLLFQNVVIVFCVRCSLQQKCRLEQVLVLSMK